MAEFKVGQKVETASGQQGFIRYVGEIHVSNGQFLGVELLSPDGKNDGAVQGERYFQCAPGYGLFLRPAAVKIIAQPPPPRSKPAVAAAAQKAPTARPGASRTSLRPTSVGGPPTPSRTPSAGSRRSVVPSSSQAAAPKAPLKRQSIASSSSAASSKAPARAIPSPTKSSAAAPKPTAAPPKFPIAPSKSANAPSRRTSGVAAISSSAALKNKAAETEALEQKIRLLESQITEYRNALKDIDTIRSERDHFKGLITKLQTKCQTFHTEATELKAQLQDSQTEIDRLSRNESEHEEVLELATLEREVAEERAEQAEAELETVRQRLEEKELELEILQSEAELLTEDMSEEDKQAAGHYRLQKENDRLREALLRLKEITDEEEEKLKAEIKELEADQGQNEELRQENERLLYQCASNEEVIEDLRQQLDAAGSFEEMVEELSEQNQNFRDRIAEKEIIIKDLENLKELNDELEAYHVEQASEMRAELEERENELADQVQKLSEQEATMSEQDHLINRFRDLVLDLQSKMTDAESAKMMSEEATKDVTDRFHETMELNRQLHEAQLSSTVKTIRSEMHKLQAQEAQEQLEIVKNYLPGGPASYQNDSLRAYFRAKRIGFKCELVSTLIKSSTVQSDSDDEENFANQLIRGDIMHQLSGLAAHSVLFWSAISTSDLSQYARFGVVYEELEPIEKNLESCIDAIKKDECNYQNMSDSLRRSNLICKAISADFNDSLKDRPADQTVFYASRIKVHFEHMEACYDATTKSLVKITVADEDFTTEVQPLLDHMQQSANRHSKAMVSADGFVRTLEASKVDGMYPRFSDGIEGLIAREKELALMADAIFTYTRNIARLQLSLKAESIPPSEWLARIDTLKPDYPSDKEIAQIEVIKKDIYDWNEYASILNNNVEIEPTPAPWVLKAAEVEASQRKHEETERELHTISAEYNATRLQIRERNEIIETKDLEIEHLKAKHKEATTKVSEMGKINEELKQKKKEAEDLRAQMEKDLVELERLRQKVAMQQQSEPTTPATRDAPNVFPSVELVAENQGKGDMAMAPQGIMTVVEALRSENRWLRRRDGTRKIGYNLDELFSGMKRKGDVDADADGIADSRKPAMGRRVKADKRKPLVLEPVSFGLGWRPRGEGPRARLEELEELAAREMEWGMEW